MPPWECRALGRAVLHRRGHGARRPRPGHHALGRDVLELALLSHLGKADTSVRELSVGYRVPRQILDYASSLLAVIAPELRPATSLRADPGALDIVRVPPAALARELVAAARRRPACRVGRRHRRRPAGAQPGPRAGRRRGGAWPPGSDSRLTLVPVTLAKGLEFDHVIVVEPALIAQAEARGLHRLYVALTRAVSRLTILHAEPLPEPLPASLCRTRLKW